MHKRKKPEGTTPSRQSKRIQQQDENEKEYEVEAIEDVRQNGEEREYLIRWKGSGVPQHTWEPRANLTHCDVLLKAFEDRNSQSSSASKTTSNIPQLLQSPQVLFLFFP